MANNSGAAPRITTGTTDHERVVTMSPNSIPRGGTIGLMLALLATVITGPAIGLVFSNAIFARALAMVTLLALATGALPALNALRIPIISAFRTR